MVLDYIKQYRAIAVREMLTYGIPASITLAQGILESGAGKSELALKSNNHFGIKCHNEWVGEKVYYDDDAANECFRKYNHPQESFHDHSIFLTTRQRYAGLFALEITDYKGWAKGLKSAGYATNPQYAELLIQLIEDYNLHVYDKMSLADVEKLEKEEGTIVYIENKNDDKNAAAKNVKAAVFYFNRIPTVLVQENDTPEKIARAHNIYVKRVLNYNDIAINTPLEPGTHFYLQPKRNKGKQKHHVVKEGETMWSISRDEGVALEKLYSYNLMVKGEEPEPHRPCRDKRCPISAPAARGRTISAWCTAPT
ncbi:MAG: glucosaminidase domain-containing protein [Chitinophagales bacterium]